MCGLDHAGEEPGTPIPRVSTRRAIQTRRLGRPLLGHGPRCTGPRCTAGHAPRCTAGHAPRCTAGGERSAGGGRRAGPGTKAW
eukprot:245523-Rhodomonas_salina.1